MKTILSTLVFLFSQLVYAEINPQYVESFDLSAGHNHICAVTSIGIKCFGNAEKVTTEPPVKLKNPRMIRAGNRFSCAVVDEGIRCWGEIPNNTKKDILISNKTFPGPKLLAVGYAHACAVSTTDKIMCFGLNDYKESTPPLNLKNITELSLGMNNSCAIADGQVVCWGLAVTGSLDVPTDLVHPRNLTSGWWHHCVQSDLGIRCWGNPYKEFTPPNDPAIMSFTSGGFFNCAIVDDGVKCWDHTGLTNLVEGSAGATKISIGSTIGCAITSFSGVICWKLGNKGPYKKMLSFVPAGGIFNIDQIAAGPASSCAYGDGGYLKCWGANFENALNVPSYVNGPLSSLTTGGHKTCAINGSELLCWGDTNSDYETPKNLGPVSMVSSGGYHVCAGRNDFLKCWGDNIRGATDVPKNLTNVTSISSGFTHTCAVASNEVKCWGGNGLIKNVNPPKKMLSPRAICTGSSFSCSISPVGRVECWGEKIPLAIKNDPDPKNMVLNVPKDITDATEISCGGNHGCAIYKGKVKCWGNDSFLPARLNPPANIKNPHGLTSGWNHTCVLSDNGLHCWGTMLGMDMPNYSLEK